MPDPDKRQFRKLKRDIKREGSKRVRRRLKDELRDNPDEAHEAEVDFGKLTSEPLNGLDQDATRRKKTE